MAGDLFLGVEVTPPGAPVERWHPPDRSSGVVPQPGCRSRVCRVPVVADARLSCSDLTLCTGD